MKRSILFLSLLLSMSWSGLVHAQTPRKEKSTEAPARSQNRIPSPPPGGSAKEQAWTEAGSVRDTRSDDNLVAHSLYVKVKDAPSYSDAVATATRAAIDAGLSPRHVTALSQLTPDLLPSPTTTNAKLMSQRDRGIVVARRDLGRMVELYYGSPLHPRAAAAKLMAVAGIDYADPIHIPRLLAPPNDPLIDRQYQLGRIHALEAWDIWSGDTTMAIGVVDAGIDISHEDLVQNIQENAGESGNDGLGRDKRTNGVDDDNNGAVDDWRGANMTWQLDGTTPGQTVGSAHGTQVSGLAAASTNNGTGVAGVANRCRFFPVKAASNQGGELVKAYEGLAYCARRGFKVINCSWGSTGYSQALQDIIQNLVAVYDCAIVASGGNSPVYTLLYPAGYRGVLGVGAIDKVDEHATAWGEHLGVVAPGGYSTSDNNEYLDLGTATSFAAPIVSGTVALVRSRFPTLNAAQALAHVRLTCDTLPTPSLEQHRLTGYGRINVVRAVSTDPFSHAALIVDTVALLDEGGRPTSRLPEGAKGSIRLRLKSLLGPVTGLRVRVVHYTDDRSFLALDSTWIDVGNVDADAVVTLASTVPFEVLQGTTRMMRFRVEFQAAGYEDYQYVRHLFYQPYVTERTVTAAMSLTDHGRIGYEDGDNTIGEGVKYQDRAMLYEGGFFVASDTSHVLNNIRNAIPDMQQEDFRPVEYPAASNGYTLTLLDDNALGSRAIGLRLMLRLLSHPEVPDAIAIQLRTTYTGEMALDTLRIAMFADWDLDNGSRGQGVVVRTREGAAVPLVAVVEGTGPTVLTHGVLGPLDAPIAYPFRNDSLPFDLYNSGFDDGEKWATVSNGVGTLAVERTELSDISVVVGRAVAQMSTDRIDTTVFIVGFGASEAESTGAVDELASRLNGPASAPGQAPMRARPLSTPWPNPASDRVAVFALPTRNGRMTLVDTRGAVVRDLTQQIDSINGPTLLTVDLTGLPSGTYYLRLQSDEGDWSDTVVKQ